MMFDTDFFIDDDYDPCQIDSSSVNFAKKETIFIDDDYDPNGTTVPQEPCETVQMLRNDALLLALQTSDFFSAVLLIEKGVKYEHLMDEFPILEELVTLAVFNGSQSKK